MAEPETMTLDCGHEILMSNAVIARSDSKTYCRACADASELQTFLDDATTHYSAYISEDGKSLVTWTGGHLAHIALMRDRKMPPDTVTVWAFDSKRRWWYGVGSGPNMYIGIKRTSKGAMQR